MSYSTPVVCKKTHPKGHSSLFDAWTPWNFLIFLLFSSPKKVFFPIPKAKSAVGWEKPNTEALRLWHCQAHDVW